MAAPKGNKFWEARSSHGPSPKFESPEALWKACTEYFQWNEDNPLWENKVAQYQGAPVDMTAAKMRALTLNGLYLFLDIAESTWASYRSREDISGVVERVERMIYNQKVQGAAADLFNANIIARELGLKDKTETNVHLAVIDLSEDELDRRLQQLESEENAN